MVYSKLPIIVKHRAINLKNWIVWVDVNKAITLKCWTKVKILKKGWSQFAAIQSWNGSFVIMTKKRATSLNAPLLNAQC